MYFVIYLEHPWLREGGEALDKPIDSAVLSRMKQFRAMNKLKKLALKVSFEVVIIPNLGTKYINLAIDKILLWALFERAM